MLKQVFELMTFSIKNTSYCLTKYHTMCLFGFENLYTMREITRYYIARDKGRKNVEGIS